MGTVIVDGQEIEIGDDERLNGIEVARRAGADVPHYCWHKGLTVVASCRMCLVETGTKNEETGEISMMPKLVPACQTPARDGAVFVTKSEKVEHARAFVEEALLIDHPIDCSICDKAGECLLQDYHFQHGQQARRADIRPFTSRRKDLGETVTLFTDRCVMCSRCVRFTREVSGTSELMVESRGAREEINIFDGFPLENKLSGNVVDLCPVGALGDRDFLYKQRVWFMKKHDGVCTGCSTGCSITVEENQDTVYRLRPRENQAVNQWWMCDEGRYGYHHVHDEKRLVEPMQEDEPIEWSAVGDLVANKLELAGRLAGVISPHLTVEEAYMFAKLLRSHDPGAWLVLGHIPTAGADETFPTGFTIHAEKCPNRRGVEEVLKYFTGGVTPWEEVVSQASTFGAIWVTAGYKTDWIDSETAGRLRMTPQLIVQDMFASPAWDNADIKLPGVAFAERNGSYVNFADRLQSAEWAVRPPAGARVEGSLYWQMLKEAGLYKSSTVLAEVAQAISYFAPAAAEVPETGVDLKASEMAPTE